MRVLLPTYGSLGDLHPFMALGLEMKRRGHDCHILTSPYHRQRVEQAGLSFVPIRPHGPMDEAGVAALVREMMHPTKGSERVLREYMLPYVADSHADLLAASPGADLIVSHELAYAAPLVAEQTGIPWASPILAPITLFSAHDPSVLPNAPLLRRLRWLGPAFHRLIYAQARRATLPWCEPIRRLREELSLPPGQHPIFDDKFSPRSVPILFSRTLAAPQPDWPAAAVQTGFPFLDTILPEAGAPPPDALRSFLESGEPPLVFTLGSAAVYLAGNFYQAAAEAARQLGRRAILLTGLQQALPDTRSLPPGVAAFPYLPHHQVFPHAAAIIHQGGVGTTAQALRAGHPQIIIPFAHDQFDHAARIERLGLGGALPKNRATPRNLATLLNKILTDRETLRKTEETAIEIQTENALEKVGDALERV